MQRVERHTVTKTVTETSCTEWQVIVFNEQATSHPAMADPHEDLHDSAKKPPMDFQAS